VERKTEKKRERRGCEKKQRKNEKNQRKKTESRFFFRAPLLRPLVVTRSIASRFYYYY
jgi:hypothetical protein